MTPKTSTTEAWIRCNATGEVRQAVTMIRGLDANGKTAIAAADPAEVAEFFWTDGNFGCDCNRAMQFAYADGVELADGDPELECSTGRYAVRVVVDGTTVVDEMG